LEALKATAMIAWCRKAAVKIAALHAFNK